MALTSPGAASGGVACVRVSGGKGLELRGCGSGLGFRVGGFVDRWELDPPPFPPVSCKGLELRGCGSGLGFRVGGFVDRWELVCEARCPIMARTSPGAASGGVACVRVSGGKGLELRGCGSGLGFRVGGFVDRWELDPPPFPPVSCVCEARCPIMARTSPGAASGGVACVRVSGGKGLELRGCGSGLGFRVGGFVDRWELDPPPFPPVSCVREARCPIMARTSPGAASGGVACVRVSGGKGLELRGCGSGLGFRVGGFVGGNSPLPPCQQSPASVKPGALSSWHRHGFRAAKA